MASLTWLLLGLVGLALLVYLFAALFRPEKW
ncbi:K(+)-transporting ATPase subunit F [Arthrobacter wenxiniae]|jgi:K+-transporting ATPase KdpF subunit|uniref:K(+)-transporting ATPase subunit F n=1 Tax=Arthrobacter wenxiniae TaxID=2713570 RepID=A0A7Y7LY43_9MICC|nr:K(+)-transporting ATPase subunit F [Arthrobacter wenxiniae]NVM93353.1 K(+)-transporting ATPase subunit F [Arthrobacter wenxiniae]